jgi:3' terminal RNA ribose 2'-O-methyltransferase Hen1
VKSYFGGAVLNGCRFTRMLLTITTTHTPATDLGFLLHKNPARCQRFELTFGHAYVFFPEASPEKCTAALLLDVDPIGIVRGKAGSMMGGPLDQYVNDRPYAATSLLSVALLQVFGSACKGQCKEKPDLTSLAIPLTAKIPSLPCRYGGDAFLRKLFEPLGYTIEASRLPLDERFPEWGESPYFDVTIRKTTPLKQLLTHLYVLIPVLDNKKHYYVGDDEVEKLLRAGEGWLASHPEKEAIAHRYLKYRQSLAREALARLVEEEDPSLTEEKSDEETPEDPLENQISLNDARLGAVMAALKSSGAKRILDLGCGEGKLLRELMKVKQFEQIVGMDVSIKSLEIANERLRLDNIAPHMRDRVKLMHGSLLYRDKRLEGFDAAALIEVIEHLDHARLAACERVIFEFAKPRCVVVTTPNREYNKNWNLGTSNQEFRHPDHRFEWSRDEFRRWADGMAERFRYRVTLVPVGPEAPETGAPTQMAIFEQTQS